MAVAFDAVGPSASGSVSATTPDTWTHVCGGTATHLLVGATWDGASDTGASMSATYNSVTMTSLGTWHTGGGTAGFLQLWYLDLAGGLATGSHSVSITFSGGATPAGVNAGSVSFTGASGLSAVQSAVSAGAAANPTLTFTGSSAGNMIAAFCGSGALTTQAGSFTNRYNTTSGTSAGGAGFAAGSTLASPGGSATANWTMASDFWAVAAVELVSAGTPAQGPKEQRGGRRYRSHFGHRQTPQPALLAPQVVTVNAGVAASSAAANAAYTSRFITGLAGTGAGYFTDNTGGARMWAGDEIWALLTNAGRWNSGNYQATFDSYFATRAAQGYTVCYSDMFNSTFIGGAVNGQMWNGQTPFTSNNPSSGLNSTYWQVIDYAVTSAQANGITLALSFGGHWDWDVSGNAMFGFTGTQYTDAGNAIGSRYKNQPNIIWLIMDDYFGSFDSSLSSLLTGLRASGDTHPIAIENYPETSSRFDLSTNGSLPWGASNTQFNFGYSYSCTYLCVEYMFGEASPLTPIYGDGYFYQGGSTYAGGSGGTALDRAARQDAWWAVTSGARGWNLGDEALWQWASTAPAMVSTQWFAANNLGNIRTFMESLPGWQTLAPDTSSVLVTGGRGTRASQLASGGGGGQYEPATTNSFVSASRTPDTGSGSSLAVMYLPNSTTVTIDQTKMVTGYVAFWVDPITGAKTSTTAGSTYNSTAKGSNSQGDPDWVLLLQAPSAASTSASAGVATSAAAANAPAVAVTASAAAAAAAAAAPAPAVSAAANAGVAAAAGVAPAAAESGTASPAAAASTAGAPPPQAAVTVNAGAAAGSAVANAATVSTAAATNAPAAAAAAAAAAVQPAIAVTAGAPAAASAGTALAPSSQAAATAAVATSAGQAPAPQTAATATASAVTSAAQAAAPGIAITAAAAAAASQGSALQPIVNTSGTTNAPAASAASTAAANAPAPAVTVTAGAAAATAAAPSPSAAVTAGAAAAASAAVALQAAVTTVGSGSASPAAATGQGAAPAPAVQVKANAGVAASAGTAPAATRPVFAAVATATAAAPAAVLAALAAARAAAALAQAPAAAGNAVIPAVFGTATPGGSTLTAATPGGTALATATAGGQP